MRACESLQALQISVGIGAEGRSVLKLRELHSGSSLGNPTLFLLDSVNHVGSVDTPSAGAKEVKLCIAEVRVDGLVVR